MPFLLSNRNYDLFKYGMCAHEIKYWLINKYNSENELNYRFAVDVES